MFSKLLEMFNGVICTRSIIAIIKNEEINGFLKASLKHSVNKQVSSILCSYWQHSLTGRDCQKI